MNNNTNNSIDCSKKERKQRVVKNAHVEIEDVNEVSGYNYCNWIQITKQKLKEREKKLINTKIDIIERIFQQVCFHLLFSLSISPS